ncbi:TPA: Na+/H+ antiporter NhaC family protein, partial [Clostridioides difficile]|nr:Na+/H+ antiporter NhaC family protein [Clostridioides difficile]
MRNKKINIIFLTTIMFIMSTVMVFAEEDIDTIALANAEKFGILTLIPPLVAIILAFITKNVIISLLIGILSGSFIIKASGINVFATFIQAFLDLVDRALVSLADPWNAGIILQVLAIGGVINLVAKMGGAK